MKSYALAFSIVAAMSPSATAQQAVQWRVEDGGNGHWYLKNSEYLTWVEARSAAQSIGGDLAGFETGNEWAWAESHLSINMCLIGARQSPGSNQLIEGWNWVSGLPVVGIPLRMDDNPCGVFPNGIEDGQQDYAEFSHGALDDINSGPSTGCPDDGARWSMIEWSTDCNNDGIVDYGQCRDGSLPDYDGDNVPDCCEAGTPCTVGTYPVQWRADEGGNGHWYQGVPKDREIKWSEAKAAAHGMGGHLATLTSEAEDYRVWSITARETLWQTVTNPYFTGGKGPWLGLHQAPDAPSSGAGWTWVTGEPVSWVHPSFDPNDGCNALDEDALNYISNGSPARVWNDFPGEEPCPLWGLPRSFIIEWSADCNNDGIVDYGQILTGVLGDWNNNGIPDPCDPPDSDGDGTPDDSDACPTDPLKTSPGTCGCGIPDTDADADGVVDCLLAESVAALATLAPSGVLAGDDFGAAVALTSDFAAVGSPLDDLPSKTDAGSVRVFARGGSNWTQVAFLQAPDSAAGSRFGASVSLSGDVLVVGSPFADLPGIVDAGAAYVFRRSGANWNFERKFARTGAAASDRFGTSVAVRGPLSAIGTPLANRSGLADSGEVTVFRFDGAAWTETATLGSVPVTASDQFGASVALGGPADAPLLAVGTPGDDETGKLNCGAAYAVPLSSAGAPSTASRLVGAPTITGAGLGASVAVDSTGTRVAAGAPLADFTGMTDRGSATVWTLSGATWTGANLAHAYLAAGDRFGASLAWSTLDACLVVGAPNDKIETLVNRGSAAVLSRRGDGSYQLHDLLVLPASGTSPSLFGTAVASSDAGLLIGAPKHTPPAGGTARMFAAPSPCAGVDTDSDGTDDCTDGDDDGDGTSDGSDLCGRDPLKIAPGTCGCGVADTDSDSDGTPNCNDLCPNDVAKLAPGQCGCGVADTDSDADGTANCNDGCPNDAAKLTPGLCGCGSPETGDTDGDELVDCLDFDDDNDGVNDGSDGCPLDAAKTVPGLCGCGVADTDSDADGTPNCSDGCPNDAAKLAPGVCGCGTADVDADADGLVDCLGGGTLVEIASLDVTGVASGDDFGAAVAGDGDVLVVGLPLDDLPGKADAGSARVYRRSGGTWTQEAQLLAPTVDAKTKDYFGTSVAIHGDVAVVGAPTADPGGVTDAGAAFVYRRVGGAWTYEGKLLRPGPAASDRFATSVAVRGEFIAVGAPQANAEGLSDSGETTVFVRVGGLWTPTEILTGVPATAADRFGQAVALGGSVAAPTLAVGATGDDQTGKSNCGAVYLHTLNADGTVATVARVVAANPIAAAGLGASVAIDAGGTRVAAGAPLGDRPGVGTDSGLATVWTLAAGAWTPLDLNPPDHAAGERYGTAVAFTESGLSLAIGSPFDTVGGVAQRGSVAVFKRSGTSWAMFDRLTIAGGTSASRSGTAVATVTGGIAAGAPKHTPPAGGAVRVFEAPAPPSLAWATTLEFDPDPAVVTNQALRHGIIATGLPWRVRDELSQVEMLLVPPGNFEMGCSASQQFNCYAIEYPVHTVVLTDAFYIGRYEVTQSQWQALIGNNPSTFQGDLAASRPVENVSWNAVQGFLSLSNLRLPSEAEWEYAYRAGTSTAYHGAVAFAGGTNDDSKLGAIAWFDANSGGMTHAVGQKLANAFGLHDMSGNVWEWVNDWFSSSYYQGTESTNPTGPMAGFARVLRGGAWVDGPHHCRASVRNDNHPPEFFGNFYGFRVARNP